MITTKKLNTKAFQELVLYYLRERITHKNLEVKYLVATNINEWFIFDATIFDRLFAHHKNLVKQFSDFEGGRLADTKTDFFYKQIAEPFIADISTEIEFTYFNFQDYQKALRNADKADDHSLIALFKLLSPAHLLKQPFTNDSNSLDKRFYSELLHIIGLTETKEGGKKLIERNKEGERHSGTLLEDAIIQLDSLDKLSRFIKERIGEKEPFDIVDYIINLSEKFRMSVELVSTILPKYDIENRLIGDVLILDKRISLEFFILLFHLQQSTLIQSITFVRDWERFLFIRDFHDKYYYLVNKDNFEDFFFKISKSEFDSIPIKDILNLFIANGFRKDKMDEGNLPKTVVNYINEHKLDILNKAFYWWTEKMVYIIYKYELSKYADFQMLREIMKKGRSIEHILPQAWEWVGPEGEISNNDSEKGKEFHKEMESIINGIGNLLLVTGSENSSLGNTHPQEKEYKSCKGGSYAEHNSCRSKWEDYKEWGNIINNRGELIYEFIKKFIV